MSSSARLTGTAAAGGRAPFLAAPRRRCGGWPRAFFLAGWTALIVLLAVGCGGSSAAQSSDTPQELAQKKSLGDAAGQVAVLLLRDDASLKAWDTFQGAVTPAQFQSALTKRTNDCVTELQKVRAIKPPSVMTATWHSIVDWFQLGLAHCRRQKQLWVGKASLKAWNAEIKAFNAQRDNRQGQPARRHAARRDRYELRVCHPPPAPVTRDGGCARRSR